MNTQNPSVEIFSQGEEIVTGQTTDTNAAWLSQELTQLGFDVVRHTAVGDRLDALITLLREIADRADCCICTGGLGPTGDDLTAEAVARAFDLPLAKDPEALTQIEAHFSRMGLPMPEANIKQALFPEGVQRLDNDWGTAPGFVLQAGQCWFAFVPGVPYEMRQMFHQRIKSFLAQNFDLTPLRRITLSSVGLGESAIQERLQKIRFPEGVILGFRSGAMEIQTKLLFEPGFAESGIRFLTNQVSNAIGKSVFWIEGLGETSADLIEVIGRSMQQRQGRLVVVETLSGGKIAARCAGTSWLHESLVKPNMAALVDNFGLVLPVLDNEQSMAKCVAAIAEFSQNEADVEFALAQLWCGDVNALQDKTKTIKLCTALSTSQGVFQYSCSTGGTGARKQTRAATIALDMLRRYLYGLLSH